MTKLKDIDFRILFELMKNSKRSARQLAKKLGVSQPTITKRRARLEEEVLDGYTAVPKWDKLCHAIALCRLHKFSLALGTYEFSHSMNALAPSFQT